MRALAATIVTVLATACASGPPPLHGTPLVPPPPAPAFRLTDQNGQAFSLAQARGSAVAVYFGFTHCADVCPQTLALLGRARRKAGLTPRQARIVMVTVDPARDTPAALRAFFRRAGVRATGLTGSPQQLRRVYHAYGIAVEPYRNDILHTDRIVLIDPAGREREVLDPKTPVKALAADLRTVGA